MSEGLFSFRCILWSLEKSISFSQTTHLGHFPEPSPWPSSADSRGSVVATGGTEPKSLPADSEPHPAGAKQPSAETSPHWLLSRGGVPLACFCLPMSSEKAPCDNLHREHGAQLSARGQSHSGGGHTPWTRTLVSLPLSCRGHVWQFSRWHHSTAHLFRGRWAEKWIKRQWMKAVNGKCKHNKN
jgi:hypothetical protein